MGICNTPHDLPNKGCVLNKTEDFNFNIFNLITGTNESKYQENIYHVNVNVNSMVQNVTPIKSGIITNADVSAKI